MYSCLSTLKLSVVMRFQWRCSTIFCGFLSAVITWYTWGFVNPTAGHEVNDERSYLLQADLFASGHWTAPSPPTPDFFEQPEVLVTPAVASKFPPGHALLLALGAKFGFDALSPILLAALTGGLLVAVTSSLVGRQAAIVAWGTWISTPLVLHFQPSYLSEVTTEALLLLIWWCLVRWEEARKRAWLLAVAASLGWCAITRPLTAVAFAIPVAVVVLRNLREWARCRDLIPAFLVGGIVTSLLIVWNTRTTGDWLLAPIELYRIEYTPFDRIGFATDTSRPLLELQPPSQEIYQANLRRHLAQRARLLPEIALSRANALEKDLYPGWRLILIPCAGIGLLFFGRILAFGIAASVALFVAYLTYAHPAMWTVYYLEATPVAAMVTAGGIWTICQAFLSGRAAACFSAACAVAIMVLGTSTGRDARALHIETGGDLFTDQVQRLFTRPAIIFVRYDRSLSSHVNFVFNRANLAQTRVWVVHDLGPRNKQLRMAAPDRGAVFINEDQAIIFPVLTSHQRSR